MKTSKEGQKDRGPGNSQKPQTWTEPAGTTSICCFSSGDDVGEMRGLGYIRALQTGARPRELKAVHTCSTRFQNAAQNGRCLIEKSCLAPEQHQLKSRWTTTSCRTLNLPYGDKVNIKRMLRGWSMQIFGRRTALSQSALEFEDFTSYGHPRAISSKLRSRSLPRIHRHPCMSGNKDAGRC